VSVVKTVLMVLGAGCVGATVAVFALMGWTEYAMRRDCRRRDHSIAQLMDDMTRIERSQWDRSEP